VKVVAGTILAVVALAGCGSHTTPSPEAVARSWSADLDRNDNEAAARLFADGARIVQSGEIVLGDHAAAVQWNASLPCGGRIISVSPRGKTDVLVVFRLAERPGHRCDGPGTDAAALFRVRGGRIVLWHQTTVPPVGVGGTIV
jgi:hypothetical protein